MPSKNAFHLFGQAHVRSYRETEGEVGHDWIGTSTLLLTTIGRRSGDDSDTPPAWYFNLTERPEVAAQVRATVHRPRSHSHGRGEA